MLQVCLVNFITYDKRFQSFSGAKRLRIQEISGSSLPDDAVLSMALNISDEHNSHLWLPGFVCCPQQQNPWALVSLGS